jgi:hypothetical protein
MIISPPASREFSPFPTIIFFFLFPFTIFLAYSTNNLKIEKKKKENIL